MLGLSVPGFRQHRCASIPLIACCGFFLLGCGGNPLQSPAPASGHPQPASQTISVAAPEAPFAGGVLITSYNAKCDGTTDDSAAFAAASQASTVLAIPEGTCVLDNFVPQKDTAIIGRGRDQSFLRHKPGSRTPMISSSKNLYIFGVTLDGNEKTQAVRNEIVRFSGNYGSLYVSNARFQNSSATAVFGSNINNLFSITDSEFRDLSLSVGSGIQPYPNTSTAVYISSGDGGNVVIRGNWFVNPKPEIPTNAPAGVQILGDFKRVNGARMTAGSGLLEVPGESVFRPQDAGKLVAIDEAGRSGNLQTTIARVVDGSRVMLTEAADRSTGPSPASWTTATMTVDISNNEFRYFGNKNNSSAPIEVYHFTNRTTISYNRAYGSGYTCFMAANSNALQIVNNLCTDDAFNHGAPAIFYSGGARAYDIANYSGVTISGNIVRNWRSGPGISVAGRLPVVANGTRRVIISRNIIEQALSGIRLNGVGEVLLDGNLIHHSSGKTTLDAGISVSQCDGYVRLTGGAITESSSYGFASESGNSSCDFSVSNVYFSNNKIAHMYVTSAKSVVTGDSQFRGTAAAFQIGVGNYVQTALLSNNEVDSGADKNVYNVNDLRRVNNSFDKIDFSAPYTAGPILPNAEAVIPVKMEGAKLGDFVIVSFTADLHSLDLTAQVSEDDLVRVVFRNRGVATVVPEGDIHVRVLKR
jgi:hypothetical protein